MSSGGETSSDNPVDKAKQDALYEDREPKKIIRIITVTAYMVSVSFVGIVLSAYYIFLWHPPNPRLMHAQSISSEARLDYQMAPKIEPTTGAPSSPMLMTRMAASLDLFAAADAEEKLYDNNEEKRLKTRREIVKNVNPVLKANFEKNNKPSGEITLGLKDAAMLPPVIAESSSDGEAPSSANSNDDETDRARNSRTSSLKNDASSEEISDSSSTTATRKANIKKQHQMPFALKHLEVPIKSEGSRKRPMKVNTAPSTRGTLLDGTTPVGPGITESSSQSIYAESSPREAIKSNLYRTLTTPASQRDVDYSTDLPLMPSISSDQFQAVARINNDEEYHDSTIVPGSDDLIDD